MYKVGDAVVHPARGAGVIVELVQFKQDDDARKYYNIELIGQSNSNLMVPVETAEEIGLRHAVSQSTIRKVWRILRSTPDALPEDHNKRYNHIGEMLQGGTILKIAEAVRDMAWRQHERNGLTAKGKRIYERALTLLSAEIAAVQETEIEKAEAQVRSRLQESQTVQVTT